MSRPLSQTPRIRLSAYDKRAIWAHAQHRWHGKEYRDVDATVRTDVDRVKLNAIGIAGEILYARLFGVPWYQNPGSGGDHHRQADLQLRDGSWFEVKATENPMADLFLYDSDGRRWDRAGVAHYDPDTNLVNLRGFATPMLIRERGKAGHRMRGEVRVDFIKLLGRDLHNPEALAAQTLREPRRHGGDGLRCPWCYRLWPCGDLTCATCLLRREEYARREAIRGPRQDRVHSGDHDRRRRAADGGGLR